MKLPCVYLAANSAYAQELAGYTQDYMTRLRVTSRWPWVYLSGQFDETDPHAMSWAWCNNIIDIQRADFLVLRCPDRAETPMRGALVEVGMAIASHLRIVIAGEREAWLRALEAPKGVAVKFPDRGKAVNFRGRLYAARKREQDANARFGDAVSPWDHMVVTISEAALDGSVEVRIEPLMPDGLDIREL